jgi:cytochrome c oxidase subunit 3
VPDGIAHETRPALHHHFDSLEQQYEAASLGMWVFLATEVLFFGGLFLAYLVYRLSYPQEFGEASRTLDLILGATNTVVLITSSLTMALAVAAAQEDNRSKTMLFLGVTMLLGAAFLGVKAVEYRHKFAEHHVPGAGFTFEGEHPEHAQIFFSLYFVMTGVHALHMVIGLGVLAVMAVMVRRGRFSPAYSTPVEVAGLYWHFVDIIWIFLFPLLYLISRHG